ncbi:thiamine diphosphokinase [Shimia gijangensis]|uniref:Thiamine diphosphokinase n=1 Tax=Shimia gijangensis TaxID=1470563 RepID=A0A1M6E0L0_9RHOB|nr:thiamine diphosphokinase [Shimia gijangensis]SHI79016.1 thiamine diphosphokinase [Shimia gijangensis]
MIVHELEPIVLIGGASLNNRDLDACLKHATRVVAADGGALNSIKNGITPDAVIGDMDSISAEILRQIPQDRIHPVTEQDSTDFDKALRNISAPLVLGVGFTGGRVDHELACYHAMLMHADRRCLLVGESDLVFVAPPELTLPLAPGTRVSLFPLAAVTGRSDGLRWPIEGLEFCPDGKIGTSNMATGEVTLRWQQPGMLVILPRDCLDTVVRALEAQSGSWPAL